MNLRHTLVLATPNRTKESCIKILLLHHYLLDSTKVLINLPITFKIKLPYWARVNGGVVYMPTVRLNLLYNECLQIHVSPSRKPVIFLGPCGNDTLALVSAQHQNSEMQCCIDLKDGHAIDSSIMISFHCTQK